MIHRDEHRENYTVISNKVLTDTRLSFETRGFLVYLLTFPDDWNFTVRNLARFLGCSTDKIIRLSKELKENGYIYQSQKCDEKGRFGAIEWEISEDCTVFENHRVRKTPNTEKVEHGENRVRESPCSDLPCTASPEHGKLEHLLITNNNQVLNKPNTNKEPSTKKRGNFVPPTVEEVAAYCSERNNSVDPESFVNFYASKGWMIGKNKMKDWKAAVITWEKRDRGVPLKKKPSGNEFLEMLREEAAGND